MTLVDALAQVLVVCFTLGSIQCRKVKRLSSALPFAFHHFWYLNGPRGCSNEMQDGFIAGCMRCRAGTWLFCWRYLRAHNADAQNKVHALHARCIRTRSPHWSEAKPLGQQVQSCLNPTTETPRQRHLKENSARQGAKASRRQRPSASRCALRVAGLQHRQSVSSPRRQLYSTRHLVGSGTAGPSPKQALGRPPCAKSSRDPRSIASPEAALEAQCLFLLHRRQQRRRPWSRAFPASNYPRISHDSRCRQASSLQVTVSDHQNKGSCPLRRARTFASLQTRCVSGRACPPSEIFRHRGPWSDASSAACPGRAEPFRWFLCAVVPIRIARPTQKRSPRSSTEDCYKHAGRTRSPERCVCVSRLVVFACALSKTQKKSSARYRNATSLPPASPPKLPLSTQVTSTTGPTTPIALDPEPRPLSEPRTAGLPFRIASRAPFFAGRSYARHRGGAYNPRPARDAGAVPAAASRPRARPGGLR
ncbi:hypothetical protein GGI42DRAFT_82176 [Trichoderma sp. SZMC 28013]